VHGCSLADATDQSEAPTPRVRFSSFFYVARCTRIRAGQSIVFEGDLGFHPLVGGQVTSGADPLSPIGTTSSGDSTTIGFPNPGTFPYFCENHGSGFGMTGAVFVLP